MAAYESGSVSLQVEVRKKKKSLLRSIADSDFAVGCCSACPS